MANTEQVLILIKNEDKTSDISRCIYNQEKNVYWVTFQNGKTYHYSPYDVSVEKDPVETLLSNTLLLKEGVVCREAVRVLKFRYHTRIFYKSGWSDIAQNEQLQLIHSALEESHPRNVLLYFRKIADAVGLVNDGKNILKQYYDKLDFVRCDSILADYLKGKISKKKQNHTPIIYPFGFNLSQKQAVDTALSRKISVIQGPPGTGKTQTILNIIANAVLRKESVAVVSGNNEAIRNVYEKLEKQKLGFLVARLGNHENKEDFILHQQTSFSLDFPQKTEKNYSEDIVKKAKALEELLSRKNDLAQTEAERDALLKEQEHFYDCSLISENSMDYFFKKNVSSKKILLFGEEYRFFDLNKILSFSEKIKMRFTYGIKSFSFWGTSAETVSDFCQKIYYEARLQELNKKIQRLQIKLLSVDFSKKMKEYEELSKEKLYKSLKNRYSGSRREYSLKEIKQSSAQFAEDYPVILSTTYSLRNSLSSDFLYDYILVDESSQVDLATGVLALSCAKNAVIVGDSKQLQNVITTEDKKITKQIFNDFAIETEYDYSKNNLLSSVLAVFPDIEQTLLREHYRCHPEIIEFCNQRFYNGELIVLTNRSEDKTPFLIYRTVRGNHARNHFNQRQIDVIQQEVIPQQNLNKTNGSIGIITPYKNQSTAIQTIFSDGNIKVDTVDKFQGQERDTIIFSTVDNEIGDFASDPNRLNVAVSRAKKQFILVTDGNNNDKTSPIHDLIEYIQYQNHEPIESNLSSVFDNLYRDLLEIRENILKKHERISEFDSENLMFSVIRDILDMEEFSCYDVAAHVPLRRLFVNLAKLNTEELVFATNSLTHVDFLIFSKISHQPVLVVEVDGFSYHHDEKQELRDEKKNRILNKYGLPILRFSTVGSGESDKLIEKLRSLST